MCEPMAIAATAISTASSMYGQYQQHEMAEKQAEAQTEMYRQNRERTYEALGRQYGDINQRQSQEQQKATEDKEEINRQARADMARARVQAGESGIYGNSVKAGLRDISGAAARDRSTINRNLDWTLSSLQNQKQSARSSSVNRINSVQPGQKPSNGALAAGLASTAAEGAMSMSSMQPQNNSYGPGGDWFSQTSKGRGLGDS